MAVEAMDLRTSTFRFQSGAPIGLGIRTWCASGARQCVRYYVSGVPEALDEPGEYWLDNTTMRLYAILPEPGASPAVGNTIDDDHEPGDVLLSTTTAPLLNAVGLKHSTFQGIIFESARADGVVCLGCESVTLINCSVLAVGTTGVTVRDGSHTVIDSCLVSYCGATGVQLSGGNHTTLMPAAHVLNNSQILHTGLVMPAYRPSVLASGVQIAVTHNILAHSPHSAVLLGPAGQFNDVLIGFNEITQVMTDTWDVGAVYFQGHDFTSQNLSIYNNMFHNLPLPKASDGAALCTRSEGGSLSRFGEMAFDPQCGRHAVYADCCGSAGFSVSNNVFTFSGAPAGCFVVRNNGNRDMQVQNNLLVDAASVGVQTGNALLNTPASVLATALAGMRAVRWRNPPYSDHYPHLANLDGFIAEPRLGNCSARPTCPAAPFGNEISLNVIVAPPGSHPPPAPVFGFPELNRSYFNTKGEFDIANNTRLADKAVKWASSDPRRTLDFTLLPDSPAFHNGFRPIAMGSIGPHTQHVADQAWR